MIVIVDAFVPLTFKVIFKVNLSSKTRREFAAGGKIRANIWRATWKSESQLSVRRVEDNNFGSKDNSKSSESEQLLFPSNS